MRHNGIGAATTNHVVRQHDSSTQHANLELKPVVTARVTPWGHHGETCCLPTTFINNYAKHVAAQQHSNNVHK